MAVAADTLPEVMGFGMAPEARKKGYGALRSVCDGTEDQVRELHKGQDVILVQGASLFGREGQFEFAVMDKSSVPSNQDSAHE